MLITPLMEKANLNHIKLNELLLTLEKSKFITLKHIAFAHNPIQITELGRQFLRDYERLIRHYSTLHTWIMFVS